MIRISVPKSYTMKELKSILSVLSSDFLEHSQLLSGTLVKEQSLVKRIIAIAGETEAITDQDAAKRVYGTPYNKHAFETLKSHVKQRALANLLICDIKPKGPYSREAVQFKLLKMIAQADLLLAFGARPTAIKQLQKVQLTAKRYSFNELLLLSSHALRKHFWFYGMVKAYRDIVRKMDATLKVLEDEYKGEQFYETATMPFVKSKAKQLNQVRAMKKAIDQIKKIKSLPNSYSLKIHLYKLNVSYSQVIEDNLGVVTECQRAIKFLRSTKANYSLKLHAHFFFAHCESLFAMKKYDELIEHLSILRELITDKNPNRLAVERLAFLSFLRTQQLDKAEVTLTTVHNLTSLASVLKRHKEEWLLYREYLGLASRIYTNDSKRFKPREKGQLQEVSKDKLGSNVAILILDCCRLLLERDYKELEKIDKKIDNYLYRHLNKEPDLKRSATILKMFRVAIHEEGHPERTKAKVGQYLPTIHSNVNTVYDSIEVIPYDKIWSLLLKRL